MTSPDPLARMCGLFVPLSLIAFFVIRCSGSDPASTSRREVGSDGAMNSSSTQNTVMVNTTAAEERTTTTNELRGLRVMLVAELELLRAELNNATYPDQERAADQARAGDLAKGLERIDRLLAGLDGATVETWVSIRESQMNQVGEVRAWMKKHSAYNSTLSN